MNDETSDPTQVWRDALASQGYLHNPFGVLTTSGEVDVIKAADVKKDSAEKEETR